MGFGKWNAAVAHDFDSIAAASLGVCFKADTLGDGLLVVNEVKTARFVLIFEIFKGVKVLVFPVNVYLVCGAAVLAVDALPSGQRFRGRKGAAGDGAIVGVVGKVGTNGPVARSRAASENAVAIGHVHGVGRDSFQDGGGTSGGIQGRECGVLAVGLGGLCQLVVYSLDVCRGDNVGFYGGGDVAADSVVKLGHMVGKGAVAGAVL